MGIRSNCRRNCKKRISPFLEQSLFVFEIKRIFNFVNELQREFQCFISFKLVLSYLPGVSHKVIIEHT